ncbi:MAG: ribosome recycling factor [Pseudomonadota bacterium]
MANPEFDLSDLERRMNGALASLKNDFGGLRTGRASAALLDPITVEAYGARMPLNQVANVSVPEPRMITVQIYDKAQVSAVEKSIRESSLNLNPVVDGQMLRIPIPELNEERRQEIAKTAHKYAEGARVAVRNVRRDGMDLLKKLEKDKEISEDDQRARSTKVQELTDSYIKKIDTAAAEKEAEIMQV